jgi:hypothetical protein
MKNLNGIGGETLGGEDVSAGPSVSLALNERHRDLREVMLCPRVPVSVISTYS